MNTLPYPFNKQNLTLGYIGCLWIDNLGDRILLESTKKFFSPISIRPFSYGRKTKIIELCTRKKLFNGVLLGGGTLINSPAYIQPYHKAFNKYKKVFTFGTGVRNPEYWGPKKNFLAEWKDLLLASDYIGVRGPISQKILQELGIKNVEVTGDPALYFGREVCSKKIENKTIGINLADCGNELWGKKEDFKDYIIELSNILIQKGWKIKFCPMNRDDQKYINAIRRKIKGETAFSQLNTSSTEILSFFDDCQIFIGQRLHSAILSICSNTPTLMLEYRPKCLDFMTSMGLEKFCVRTNNLTVERTFDLLNELTTESDSIKSLISTKISFFKRKLSNAAEIISGKLINAQA